MAYHTNPQRKRGNGFSPSPTLWDIPGVATNETGERGGVSPLVCGEYTIRLTPDARLNVS